MISNVPCSGGNDETVIPSAISSPQPAAEERVSKQPVTSNPTVDAAFKSLRKIMAATNVGISMRDYGQLVVEAKVAVNDIVLDPAASKDARIRKELEATMQAYADALTAWNISLHDGHFLIARGGKPAIVSEAHGQGLKLDDTYHFKADIPGVFVSTKNALDTIWKVAQEHLMRASELTK